MDVHRLLCILMLLSIGKACLSLKNVAEGREERQDQASLDPGPAGPVGDNLSHPRRN